MQAHLLIEDCDLIEARVAKLHQLQEQEERTRQMYQFLPQVVLFDLEIRTAYLTVVGANPQRYE